MKNRFLTFFIITLLCPLVSIGQVVWTEPFFPTQDDDVTVYFDASEGNMALDGFNGQVYAHTGVITTDSNSPSDWKHVVSDWGVEDPNVLMNDLGNNLYSLEYNIQDYYGFPNGTEVLQLAFVFRNGDGSTVGRASDGSDIFSPVYPANSGLQTRFLEPTSFIIATPGQQIEVFAVASENASLTLEDNGNEIASESNAASINHTITVSGTGSHLVEFNADNGGEISNASFSYVVPEDIPAEDPPAGTLLGITHTSSTSVRLNLYAPDKDHVFVIGDFNGWNLDTDYQMKPSMDGNSYWIDIENLTSGEYYAFQYIVDGTIKIADPYSTLVLDPASDPFISEETFPNRPPYPTGSTTGICSVIQPGADEFDWQVNDFELPAKTDLVIYELLMRDFVSTRNYQTLIDTLDYLERLGINAIELMPVQEFEGNDSWGYNPSFHMALDKYYGTPEVFKTFVDEAHARGMAVIVDVVYNHAFSQSPLCQLYWDAQNFRPAPDNPWLNPEARHPFNVGYDFNHESQATKDWVDRVMTYWLEEYRIDGFRFDLSKGLTQTNNPSNVGAWGQYDASRIAILKRIADVVWSTTPEAYVILEHFAANDEETELIEYGMMVWGNMNHAYNEASMAWSGNGLTGVSYTSRNWTLPHLISYMESHDEERLNYKNQEFGNGNSSYDVQFLETALKRQELVSAFFYTVPGPKMLWEFGELGYDFSINRCTDGTISSDCRLAPKPVRWDYYDEPDRRRLYDITRALIHLKKDYEVFRTTDFELNIGTGTKKTIHLNGSDMDVTVVGNFQIVDQDIDPNFQNTGTWYEYFSGEQIEVTDVNAELSMAPGEYRLYTSVQLPEPPGGFIQYTVSVDEALLNSLQLELFPNPAKEHFDLSYTLDQSTDLEISLLDAQGRLVGNLLNERQAAGTYLLNFDQALDQGLYFLQLNLNGQIISRKLVVSK